MKTAGAVHRKLKEVTFRYWVVFYKKLTKRIPENCAYSKKYQIDENKSIYLCFMHQDLNKIDPQLLGPCDLCEQYKCITFVPKYTREEIKNLFLQELANKKLKEKKYPEICALEWVLDRDTSQFSLPKTIKQFFFKIKNILSKEYILYDGRRNK